MLSKLQKSYLSRLAERAFNRECAMARGRGEEMFDETRVCRSVALQTFRHTQVAAACGKLGLRCCAQDDYKQVEAHFLNLLGETGKAFNAHMRAQTEDRRQAEVILLRNLADYGFDHSYAEAICRNVHKCTCSEASADQLWKVIYTIRTRGNARRKASKSKHQTPTNFQHSTPQHV